MAPGGLVERLVGGLVQHRPRLLLVVLAGKRVDTPLLRGICLDARDGGLLDARKAGIFRGKLRWVDGGRMQLLVEEAFTTDLLVARNSGRIDAERHACEPAEIA